ACGPPILAMAAFIAAFAIACCAAGSLDTSMSGICPLVSTDQVISHRPSFTFGSSVARAGRDKNSTPDTAMVRTGDAVMENSPPFRRFKARWLLADCGEDLMPPTTMADT